jgi:hypothetical protein
MGPIQVGEIWDFEIFSKRTLNVKILKMFRRALKVKSLESEDLP